VSFFTLALLIVSAGMSWVSGIVLMKNLDDLDRGAAWLWGAVLLLASISAFWCSWRLL
jgi:hypothetical protein